MASWWIGRPPGVSTDPLSASPVRSRARRCPANPTALSVTKPERIGRAMLSHSASIDTCRYPNTPPHDRIDVRPIRYARVRTQHRGADPGMGSNVARRRAGRCLPMSAQHATRDSARRTTRMSSPGYAAIARGRCPSGLDEGSFATAIVPVQRAPLTLACR
jgi:hypothetical protein